MRKQLQREMKSFLAGQNYYFNELIFLYKKNYFTKVNRLYKLKRLKSRLLSLFSLLSLNFSIKDLQCSKCYFPFTH